MRFTVLYNTLTTFKSQFKENIYKTTARNIYFKIKHPKTRSKEANNSVPLSSRSQAEAILSKAGYCFFDPFFLGMTRSSSQISQSHYDYHL